MEKYLKKYAEIDFKYNLKLYWKFLSKYKWPFFLVLLLISFVEGSYTIEKWFLKIVVDTGIEYTNGEIAASDITRTFMWIIMAFFSLAILRTLSKQLEGFIHNRVSNNVMRDLKNHFFGHIINLSYDFHCSNKTGSLISRLIRGAWAMDAMKGVILWNFLPLVLQSLVVGGALFFISWKPAVAILLTSLSFIVYSIILQNRQKPFQLKAHYQEDQEKAVLADYLTNIESIKYFGKEDSVQRKFRRLAQKTADHTIDSWKFYTAMDSGQSFILSVGTFCAVYFPLVDFLNGDITLGTLTFVYTAYTNLIGPLFAFVHGVRNFYKAMADMESLFKYHRIENNVRNKPNAKGLRIKKGSILFDNIHFRYCRRKIFSGFTLDIKPNEKVAFIGHSGSGKSTLVKLLYRFYDLEKGSIQVDGKDIKDVKKESLRSELSIVPQEAILFDDTIYNNILFSRPGAKRKDVLKAIKFAQLDKVIKNFPKKELTVVGERGVKLSGGEKQRVSIARAILADKKILILDEATSALDSETEHEIQRDLEKLMKGRTSIIIAHRLSTIMSADKIVVLKKGKIVQMGTHNQLIKQKGEYKKLWNLQKGGYIT